ncbi:MAG: hypothetical protein IKX93_01760 [Bacteroidaceae bacterium]|nr:hypothetical protein [Bacteroidaceae bacterium]
MGDTIHIDINNVELYIDRFMEAETSNAEERELYRFFATEKNLPQHIAQYREMFAYFESGLDESLSAQALAEAEQSTAKTVQLMPAAETKKPKRRIFMFAASIAASIVLISGISFGLLKNDADELYSYEGSYVMQNGKRITDKETLRLMIDNTMKEADNIEMQVAQLSEISDKDDNIQSVMASSINNSEAQARVNEFLNED